MNTDHFLTEIEFAVLRLIDQILRLVPSLFLAIFVLGLLVITDRILCNVLRRIENRPIKANSIRKIYVQLGRTTLWFFGVTTACFLIFPDLQFADIIGFLGLGSVAAGFAFQDIFKNFLAGILLLLEEPFQVGDQVILHGYEGTVEAVAIRSTQIRTYQGELIDIPNSLVFTNPIQTLTACTARRTDLRISVDYNTPLPHAQQVFLMALATVDEVFTKPVPVAHVVEFASSSIDFVVRYWTRPEKSHVLDVQSKVAMALKQGSDESGLKIPYPIRTVYHFDQTQFQDDTMIASESVSMAS